MGLTEYEGVEFDEEKYIPEAKIKETGGIYGWLLSKGVVKNRKQANLVMVIGAILIAIVSLIIYSSSTGGHKNAPKLTPEDSWRAGNPSEIDNSPR